MLRLVSFCIIILGLMMFSGCRMCASYTDIEGSPVANAMSSDGMRAGSQYGGYAGGTYYMGGYQSTATPRRVFDSEFLQSPTGQRVIQTPPVSTTQTFSTGNVVPANYYSSR